MSILPGIVYSKVVQTYAGDRFHGVHSTARWISAALALKMLIFLAALVSKGLVHSAVVVTIQGEILYEFGSNLKLSSVSVLSSRQLCSDLVTFGS